MIGRPILYKTTKEFLVRFGLNEVGELPSMEEFEKLVSESFQSEMFEAEGASPGIPPATPAAAAAPQESAEETAAETVES